MTIKISYKNKYSTSLKLGAAFAIFLMSCHAWADRADTVSLLQNQESKVESARGMVHIEYFPTDEQWIPDIRAENERIGEPLSSFTVTTEQARKLSNSFEWWRKGPMERWDQYALHDDDGPSISTTAFDGRIVRTLALREDASSVVGSIHSRESAEWDAYNRVDPYSLVFEFQNTPYSDLAARSPEYTEELFDSDGITVRKVQFIHPDIPGIGFELTFDSDDRLLSRLYKTKKRWRNDEFLKPRELHRFTKHSLIELEDGETIWFPTEAEYISYNGINDENIPIEFMRRRISLEDLSLNVDIPSQHFVIEFPENAEIFDGLVGLGLIRSRGEFMDDTLRRLDELANDVLATPGVDRSVDSEDDTQRAQQIVELASTTDQKDSSKWPKIIAAMGLGIAVIGVVGGIYRRRNSTKH